VAPTATAERRELAASSAFWWQLVSATTSASWRQLVSAT
jgi:hypothetical protein